MSENLDPEYVMAQLRLFEEERDRKAKRREHARYALSAALFTVGAAALVAMFAAAQARQMPWVAASAAVATMAIPGGVKLWRSTRLRRLTRRRRRRLRSA